MTQKKQNNKTTLNSLAQMVGSGFVEAQEDRDNLRTDMNNRFDGINKRLDRIEEHILKNHEERIKRLEDALAL